RHGRVHADFMDHVRAGGRGYSSNGIRRSDDAIQQRSGERSKTTMIKIPPSLLREIYDHTEASYPNECCGVMIGTIDKDKNHTVHAFRTCKNLNKERARDRYDMDPLDMLRVEREFEKSPWDIIGIYHSHPDHPSRPSQTDT